MPLTEREIIKKSMKRNIYLAVVAEHNQQHPERKVRGYMS